jgi:predicted MFS family arabinose efflux permease
MVPRLVPKEDLPRANARLSAAMTVTNLFLGKPIGSLLFAASTALPFLLSSGGIFAAALLVLAIHGTFAPPQRPRAAARSSLAEIGEGIRWLYGNRLLRTIAVVLGILNLMLVAQNSILVLYVEERLGVPPAGFGTLVAMYGVGGLLGGLVAERVVRWLGASATLRLALINEAAVPAVLALLRNPLLFGAVYVAFGFHAVTWGALLTALRQELTPDELRGRVAGVGRLLEYGGAAPGALLGGILAARLGLTSPFWIGAIIAALLIPFAWPVFSKASIAQAKKDALG